MPITIGSKVYEVAYGKKARREIEAARGKGLMEVCRDGMLLSHAAVIWAGIKHADKKLTLDDVANAIEGTDYDEQIRECLRALLHAAPFGKKLDEATISRMVGDDEGEPGKETPAA